LCVWSHFTRRVNGIGSEGEGSTAITKYSFAERQR
jgi:hypothetical protein